MQKADLLYASGGWNLLSKGVRFTKRNDLEPVSREMCRFVCSTDQGHQVWLTTHSAMLLNSQLEPVKVIPWEVALTPGTKPRLVCLQQQARSECIGTFFVELHTERNEDPVTRFCWFELSESTLSFVDSLEVCVEVSSSRVSPNNRWIVCSESSGTMKRMDIQDSVRSYVVNLTFCDAVVVHHVDDSGNTYLGDSQMTDCIAYWSSSQSHLAPLVFPKTLHVTQDILFQQQDDSTVLVLAIVVLDSTTGFQDRFSVALYRVRGSSVAFVFARDLDGLPRSLSPFARVTDFLLFAGVPELCRLPSRSSSIANDARFFSVLVQPGRVVFVKQSEGPKWRFRLYESKITGASDNLLNRCAFSIAADSTQQLDNLNSALPAELARLTRNFRDLWELCNKLGLF